MYCKHCGKEITEDSTFCNHCGKSQGKNSGIASKPVWIIYGLWAISNLYLLMGEKEWDCFDKFYPKTQDPFDKDYYDFSEFVVYVFLLPALICLLYRIYTKLIHKVNDTTK